MKKIVELEGRWKSYKYRAFIFYVFICVFVVFLVFVGLFIKNQYNKYSIASSEKISSKNANHAGTNVVAGDLNNAVVQGSVSPRESIVADTENANVYPSISFVCRQVVANRLMVRKEPSFKSQPVGHYSKNGIFCTEDKNVNGLLQTNNGWISASDNFSKVIEVNMFVDSGFHQYKTNPVVLAQSPMEEVNVLNDKPKQSNPVQYPSSANTSVSNPVITTPNNPVLSVDVKPLINISSERITKEREIELKTIDFKNTNSYNTAIEVAEYYFGIKDYSNSIKWALNASEADSRGGSKSQSFIIYAKSLYAIDKKEQAIDVLNKYIAKTNSRDAIEALKNIRQGNLGG